MLLLRVDVALPVLAATVVIALARGGARGSAGRSALMLSYGPCVSPWRQSRGHDGSWPYRSWTADLPAYEVLEL